MPYRSTVAIVALVGLVALLACGPPSLTSASSRHRGRATPRTAWGHPDLQGVWRYEGAIPLERPAQLAERASLTEKEIAERQQLEQEQAAKRLAGQEGAAVGRRSVAESPIRGNEYNSFWQDHGRPRQVSSRTSLITDPPDGRLPFTSDARKAEARSSARYGVGPFESYLDPDTGERCLTDGVTGMMWQGPNGGHNRIVQSPGYVTILHEEYRDRRVIPLDGRPQGNIRSGLAMPSDDGKATRWSWTRRTSWTGPTTNGRTSGRGRRSRCTSLNASSGSTRIRWSARHR